MKAGSWLCVLLLVPTIGLAGCLVEEPTVRPGPSPRLPPERSLGEPSELGHREWPPLERVPWNGTIHGTPEGWVHGPAQPHDQEGWTHGPTEPHDAELPEPSSDPPWPHEDHPHPGRDVRFDWSGVVAVEGALEATVHEVRLLPAPLFPDRLPLVYVEGSLGEEPGVLVLQGDALRAVAAEGGDAGAGQGPGAFAVDRVVVNGTPLLWPHPLFAAPRIDLEGDRSAWEEAHEADFFAHPVVFPSGRWTFSGHHRAVWFADGNATDVTDAATLDVQRLAWATESRFSVDDARLELVGEAFVAAANVTAASVDGADGEGDLLGVLAYEGTLGLAPGRVWSDGAVRATQVLSTQGPWIPAVVEFQPLYPDLVMRQNESRWLTVRYAETGGEGDAVLENLTVSGSGADAVHFPLDAPPRLVEDLFGMLGGLGLAAPFFAVGVALLAPWVLLVEAFTCLFGCPEDHPYPAWMDAGSTGTFRFRVDAHQPPGDYEATITVHGANHADHALRVAWTVESPQ